MTSHFSIGLPTWQSRMPRILTDSNFKQPQHSTSLRAKRSNPCSRKGRVDCFVASLLAMTANTVSRSRCMFCPRFAFDVPPPEYQRAQGMPGARCTRSLVCDKKQTHERSHHGHTGNHPAFPAQWFYGLTWPYASALFVNCAAAPTASRPASVTIASRPSVGRDGRGYIADLGLLASKISEIPK